MVGSANLTKQGLYHNVEMMAVVADHEAARLWTEMQNLIQDSWDISERTQTVSDIRRPSSTMGDTKR